MSPVPKPSMTRPFELSAVKTKVSAASTELAIMVSLPPLPMRLSPASPAISTSFFELPVNVIATVLPSFVK